MGREKRSVFLLGKVFGKLFGGILGKDFKRKRKGRAKVSFPFWGLWEEKNFNEFGKKLLKNRGMRARIY